MFPAGVEHSIDRGMKQRMIELSGDAEGKGQIEVSDPETINAFNRCNRFNVFDTARGFDLGNQEAFSIGALHLRRRWHGLS